MDLLEVLYLNSKTDTEDNPQLMSGYKPQFRACPKGNNRAAPSVVHITVYTVFTQERISEEGR